MGQGKILEAPRQLFKGAGGNTSILVFLDILGLRWGPVGYRMRGVASLDVHEMGWSGKLGVGKNLGLLQHHFNHFLKVFGKTLLSWGCLSLF